MKSHAVRGLFAGIVALVLAGCGGTTGSVSGTVTYKGQPLPVGTITFIGSGEGTPTASAQIKDGKYQLSDAPIGSAKVTVAAPPPSTAPDPAAASAGITPVQSIAIPEKYSSPTNSGLTHTVTSGSQTYDAKLE